jgi:predicted nucleic acid-binding protein
VGLIQELGRGPVALDTACFIYLVEEESRFLPVLEPVFEALDAGRLRAVTSAVTLLEVLVVPLRAGDADLADRYEAFLTRSRGLTMLDLTRTLLRAAAELRAGKPRLRTPDALQLAAALSSRCTAFLTNDRAIPSLPGLRTLQLAEYAGRA